MRVGRDYQCVLQPCRVESTSKRHNVIGWRNTGFVLNAQIVDRNVVILLGAFDKLWGVSGDGGGGVGVVLVLVLVLVVMAKVLVAAVAVKVA